MPSVVERLRQIQGFDTLPQKKQEALITEALLKEQRPEQIQKAIQAIEPVQGVDSQTAFVQPEFATPRAASYGQATLRGAAYVGESAVTGLGIPELAYRAVKGVTVPAVRGVGKLVGSETMQNAEGFSPESEEKFFHPFSSKMARPEGLGPQLLERGVQEIGTGVLGGQMLKRLGVIAETLPLTPTILQGIGAALGGQGSEEFLKTADPATRKALEVWLPMAMTMAGSIGGSATYQTISSLWKRTPGQSVINAGVDAIKRTPQTENANTFNDFKALVPEADDATVGMRSGSPELVAAEEFVGSRRVAIADDRKTRLGNITAGTKKSLDNLFGDADDAELAVEANRLPVRTAQADAAAATTMREGTESFHEGAVAGATQTRDAARTNVKAYQLQLDESTDQLQKAQERQLAAIQLNARQRVKGNPGAIEEHEGRVGEKQRHAFEIQRAQVQKKAEERFKDIDPQDIAHDGPELLEDAVARVQRTSVGEGRNVPSSIARIRGIILEQSEETETPPQNLIITPGSQQAPTAPPLRKELTWKNFRDMRTAVLEEGARDPGVNDARMVKALEDVIEEAKVRAADRAATLGDTGVLDRDRAYGKWYGDVIRPFRQGIGATILAKQPRAPDLILADRLLGKISPELDYDVSNGQILRAVVPKAGTAITPNRMRDFAVVETSLRQEPGGIEALRDFFAHDFYAFVANPETGVANHAKVTNWLKTRQQYFDKIPELAADFSNAKTQKATLDRALADGTRDAQAIKDNLRTAEKTMPPLETKVAQTAQAKKTFVDTAKDAEKQAQAQADAAVKQWKVGFGSADNTDNAMLATYTSEALGTDAGSLLAPLKDMNPPRARHKLMQIASPVKGDTKALEGLAAGLLKQEGLGDLSLLKDPKGVQNFLAKYEPFFQEHFPTHLKDLRIIAKGFEQMKTQGSQVPPGMQDMTPRERLAAQTTVGLGAGALAYTFGRTSPAVSIGLSAGIGASSRWLTRLADDHRLTLTQKALFDPQHSRLLSLAMRNKTAPGWAETVWRGLMQNTGGIAGAPRINDEIPQ